jgi:hypothetical protein
MSTGNMSTCTFEEAVVSAMHSGTLSPELHEHAVSCPVCSDAVLVAEYLQDQAALIATSDRPLPDPGLIWWRARIEARKEAGKRATRAITIMQSVSLGIGSVITLGAAYWAWPVLSRWLGALIPRSLPTAPGWADPGPVLIISIGAIGFLVLLELYGQNEGAGEA